MNLTKYQKRVYYLDVKVFNMLPSYIKIESDNPKKFKLILQKLFSENSFYSWEEYFELQKVKFIYNQSIGMNRMWWFLAVLRTLLHSSLSCTFSCHSSPPTILPSSLTSSSHLFLGLPLGLIVSKFMYNTLLGILFSSILCTCPNQRNLCSLIVSVIVGFLIWIE